MNIELLKNKISDGNFDAKFTELYGADALAYQHKRWIDAIDAFARLFGVDRDVHIFSVPGRSEISGNHTDHNHGKVLAAAIDLDIIAVASPCEGKNVCVKSEGFEADNVVLGGEPDSDEKFTSAALIKGVAAGLERVGYAAGGFDAYTTSNVMKGSGLSSSAAFEVMIGTIQNHLYNGGRIGNPEIARISQYAENVYFGKPCGLMDQTACAVGGFIGIDFGNPAEAAIEKLPFDLTAAGYRLCITDTGGNHVDLNDDYASVPAEMKSVAAVLGGEVLRGFTADDVIANIAKLRATCGDRAIMRAFHFLAENDRVDAQCDALRSNDLDAFFAGVLASGRSSFMWLQNVYTVKNVAEQGLSLALCVTEKLLAGTKAAWRVHGGGFAGTIQAFVPAELVNEYVAGMDKVFGEGSCAVLSIRQDGAIMIV